ncbi:hypothetical protein GA830_10350 [Mesorhizobium sp. NBSH29]|nr:hypothetical protein GA830_10350 [Mesorhizobium sp. NBSH29]
MALTYVSTLKQFLPLLERDPLSIGVCWSSNRLSALEQCHITRARLDNLLFMLLPISAGHKAVVDLLTAGSDDVQTDDTDPRELAARLAALAARRRDYVSSKFSFCGCSFDAVAGTVMSPSAFTRLTKYESSVLSLLIGHRGNLVAKRAILDGVYQGRDEPDIKIIDVFVCKLRKKLFDVTGGRDVVETVWGRGYRFVPTGFEPKFSHIRKGD